MDKRLTRLDVLFKLDVDEPKAISFSGGEHNGYKRPLLMKELKH